MEEKDREILREAASEQGYTSIAINKDGKHVGGCFIPWKLTSSAINMKTPRVTLAVEDLQDEAIMADVKKMQSAWMLYYDSARRLQFCAAVS